MRRSTSSSAGPVATTGDQGFSGKITLPKKPRREKTLEDKAGGAIRVVQKLGRTIGTEHDPEDLQWLSDLELALKDAWSAAIGGLRTQGRSDAEIARALGRTRQAVEQKWPREACQ